jgi:hypothetical protein
LRATAPAAQHDGDAVETDGVDATVHGFRSSARSWTADQGIAFEVAESCLAHATGGVVTAYQRSPMVERRRPMMQVWADFVCGKDNANVVALKGRIRAPYDGRDQYAPFSWLSPR